MPVAEAQIVTYFTQINKTYSGFSQTSYQLLPHFHAPHSPAILR